MSKKHRGQSGLSGVILVDKPVGWTSHDVVAKLRNLTGERRIGHNGTLDPFASGLMAVMIGPATRLSHYLTSTTKEYEATFTFGAFTDTDDCEGSIIESFEIYSELFDESFARQTIASLIGSHEQIPPKYSAIKRDGVPAYKAARAGQDVDLSSRRITIFEADLISVDEGSVSWTVRLVVSKGTYIRSIARDLGETLKAGAYVSALRRTASGNLSVKDALTIPELIESIAQPSNTADHFLPIDCFIAGELPISSTDRHTITGQSIAMAELPATESSRPLKNTDLVPIVSLDNRLLALYRPSTDSQMGDKLVPHIVFPRGVCGPRVNPCIATMGVFDGVHRGHAVLLANVVERARAMGVTSVVVTFDVLPELVIEGQHVPDQLTALEHRIELIKQQGIDEVIIIPFDSGVALTNPSDFVSRYLLSRIAPVEFIVGDNFRFGHQGTGDYQVLAELLSPAGCLVRHVPLIALDDQHVSSTSIRQAINQGDIGQATKLLGRDITITGKVIAGQGNGAELGFPTANLDYTDNRLLLPDGVYAALVCIEGSNQIYSAAVFIGTPSTFEASQRAVEAHLLDYHADLYGMTLTLTLKSRIRETKTFASVSELTQAIEQDISQIRAILG